MMRNSGKNQRIEWLQFHLHDLFKNQEPATSDKTIIFPNSSIVA